MAWHLLFWPASVLFIGWMQGGLLPAIRRTPSGPEARGQSRALHLYGSLAYYLPVVLCPAGVSVALWVASAAVARLTLFDVVLNLSDGNPATGAFHVGQTAVYDKLLRRLSPANPARLNALVKGAAALLYALGIGFWYYCRH